VGYTPRELEEKDAARRRLAFDELLRLQLILVMKKRAAATLAPDPQSSRRFWARRASSRSSSGNLPFQLTAAKSGRSGRCR